MAAPDLRVANAARTILETLREDDFALWELLSDVRDALPGIDESDLVQVTRMAALELLEQEKIELLEGRALHEAGRAVPRAERAERLADADAWRWDLPWDRDYLVLTRRRPTP